LHFFRCQAQLGIIQYACVPDPAGTNITLTLVFKVSLVSGAKQIGCAANQELQITSAEVGSGRAIKVMRIPHMILSPGKMFGYAPIAVKCSHNFAVTGDTSRVAGMGGCKRLAHILQLLAQLLGWLRSRQRENRVL
jgi:hypothetical protein